MTTDAPDIPLPTHPAYTLRALSPEAVDQLLMPHLREMFSGNFRLQMAGLYSEQELAARARLRTTMGKPFRLTWGLFHNNAFVGWTFGWQIDHETYYMTNSAVLPEHRRKGLYTSMVRCLLARLTEEGFQIVFSRHTATNNAVLIPKLKLGFIFSSFELSDVHGTLVHLRYYTNPTRRAVMDVRSGQRRPVGRMAEVFGLEE